MDVRNSVLRSANINITKPAFSPARIFPRELQARFLEDINKYGVIVKPKGPRAVQERSQAIVLLASQPGKSFDREVFLQDRTVIRLKEQLALKFCYKSENLINIVTTKVVEGMEVEEVIEDDQQVMMLRWGCD